MGSVPWLHLHPWLVPGQQGAAGSDTYLVTCFLQSWKMGKKCLLNIDINFFSTKMCKLMKICFVTQKAKMQELFKMKFF